MVYIAVLVILLIPFVKYDLLAHTKGEGVWYFVTLISLILLAGLRYRTGGDTIIYMDIFEYYPTMADLKRFDFAEAEFNPLWYVYNSIFRTFGDSFLLYQLVQAVIVNSIFFSFFRRYSKMFFLSVLLYYLGYYCYYNMEIQREVLCVCMFLLAVPLLEKRRFLYYYLIAIFSIFIHSSATIMLFIPLFLLLKRDRFKLCLLLTVGLVAFLSVFDMVDIILSSILGKESSLVRTYLSIQTPNMIGKTLKFIVMLPYLILFYIRDKYQLRDGDFFGSLLNMVVIIQVINMFIQGTGRFSNYLLPLGVVFMINTVYDNLDFFRVRQTASLLLLISLSFFAFDRSYFYIKNRSDDLRGAHVYDRYLPYVSVFNPRMIDIREKLMINERYDKFSPEF